MRRFCSIRLLFALFLGVILFPDRQVLAAQQTFKIEKASKKYDLIVKIDSCEKDELSEVCSGSGHISVLKKGEDTPFQIIDQDDLWFDKVQTAYNPQLDAKPRVLYEHEYSLIVGDFNFDGEEDLAICNGHNGGYGAPSYTVYLFEKRSKKFIENEKLSKLADGVYLGLFFPDSKKKLLRAYWKSGAGDHVEEVYRVVNNRPILIEKTEDEVTASGYSIITTQKRINGKWVKRVRRVKIKDDGEL